MKPSLKILHWKTPGTTSVHSALTAASVAAEGSACAARTAPRSPGSMYSSLTPSRGTVS